MPYFQNTSHRVRKKKFHKTPTGGGRRFTKLFRKIEFFFLMMASLNHVTKKGPDWLLSNFLFGTEIREGHSVKKITVYVDLSNYIFRHKRKFIFRSQELYFQIETIVLITSSYAIHHHCHHIGIHQSKYSKYILKATRPPLQISLSPTLLNDRCKILKIHI